MSSVTLRSPAKLNLFLKVTHKRPDGYHNLETLFERISLWDEMRFVGTTTGAIRIFCDHPQVPRGPRNLVYRVARLLQVKYNITQGVDVYICKRIPVAAGLAGGSSNAATTFLGLNKIWKLRLSRKELSSLGREIGSDVPFFLHDTSWALGTERGDIIQPLSIPVRLWHVLVVPQHRMLTPEVYGRLNLKLTKTRTNVNILIRSFKKYNIKKAKQLLANDLETSIIQIRPSLLRAKQRLERLLGGGVCFSGSGPSVFGITDSQSQAEGMKKILERRYRRVFAVTTL